MKKQFIIPLSLSLFAGVVLSSCGGNSSSSATGLSTETTTSHASGFVPGSSEASESAAESSQSEEDVGKKAMENFAAKIENGNYQIAFYKMNTNVVSKDLIFFDYDDSLQEGHDYAAMSVDNETFQSRVDMGEIKGVKFVDKGRAMKVGEQFLPNYWFDEEALGAGVWDIFESPDPAKPLQFVPKDGDKIVRASVARFAALDALYAPAISNITMDFDKEDVTTVSIKATYSTGTAEFENLDITINLGTATTSDLAQGWINDPNRLMPEDIGAQGVWNGDPSTVLFTMLILQTSEQQMGFVPFIDFASYAVWTNMGTALQDHYGIIRDYHGTIRDVENYKERLVEQFDYTVFKDDQGEPVFRRLVRAKRDCGCYINISVSYDQGFYLKTYLTYDLYRFNTQSKLNELIADHGFAAFTETDAVHNWFGEDDFFLQTENWYYFYDFSLYASVSLKYEDQNAATAYLDAYGASLESLGFVRGSGADGTTWTKNTNEGEWEFVYKFSKQGDLSIALKDEVFADPAVMKQEVEAAGFPTVDLTTATKLNSRNHKKFEQVYHGIPYELMYRTTFYFADNDEAKRFLGQYKQSLVAAGFQQQEGTQYYVKDDLVFEPNEAAGGMCGLYFYVLPTE